ncbi:MAG: hypothetical protein QFX35_01825 [Candidatus Verstraetearchaeota archaeon]|nr:hypothetical protein [Candidatus Verstraetearchaeota archaeon]
MNKKSAIVIVAAIILAAIPVSATLATSTLQIPMQTQVSEYQVQQTCDRDRLRERDCLRLNASECDEAQLQIQDRSQVRTGEQCMERLNYGNMNHGCENGASLEAMHAFRNALRSRIEFGAAGEN